MRIFGGVFTKLALALVLTGLAATPPVPADARVVGRSRAFDGLWSVSIITRAGPCAPSYRYPVRIVGGQVTQAENDFSYQIAGVVTATGQVAVRVASGGQSATGYGRLAGSRGGGWWRADSGQCSGVWSAVRRG